MTATATVHRVCLDAETLTERSHRVALIAKAMRMDRQVWIFEKDEERSDCARQLAYMRWMVRAGVVTDGC